MRVYYIKSSCVVIESKGVKIMSDPWLVDGEYYGSWSHYPKLNFDRKFFDSIDYIYVSHIHPDHFSRKSFSLLNKEIPVLIHKYSSPFLKLNIERLGFKVTELEHNTKTHLKNDVSIDILAADNCNPALCSKFMGCGIAETNYKFTQIDSLAVISDGCNSVLNLNDCPIGLAKEAVEVVKSKYKHIDFLLVGYAGAGPYPQCFEMSNTQRKLAEESKKKQFLSQGEQYIQLVNPKFYMPFAGTYNLSGYLSKLNDNRGVPELEEAVSYFKNSDLIDQCNTSPVILNTYEYFDIATENYSKKYIPLDLEEKRSYVNNILSKIKFDFEEDDEPTIDDIIDLVPAAYKRFEQKRKEINFSSKTKLFIKLDNTNYIEISFEGIKPIIVCSTNNFTPRVEYDLSNKLLKRILMGPRYAHWNNAEVGSHIRFNRVPNNFERGLYHSICFFHA